MKDVLEAVWEGQRPTIAPTEVSFGKRLLDVALIVLSSPVSLPLFLAIAAGIKVVSPGPVFFRQERVGYRGRRFMCLKFRSMKVGAPVRGHQNHLKELMGSDKPMTKLDSKGDSRLIPMGGLLRATGLDELPQLINVLLGDMSLVGPRPCIPYEYEEYLPWQKERFHTLPGLTGLWQVSGKNKTTFKEMVNLDITYVRNRSIWLDLKIVARTIPALVAQVVETKMAASARDSRPVAGLAKAN